MTLLSAEEARKLGLVDEIKTFPDVYYRRFNGIKILSPNLSSIFDNRYFMQANISSFINRFHYQWIIFERNHKIYINDKFYVLINLSM